MKEVTDVADKQIQQIIESINGGRCGSPSSVVTRAGLPSMWSILEK